MIVKTMIAAAGALAATCCLAADTRPYEFVRANRTADEVAPWFDFESETGWTGTATDGTVEVARSQERQLFGDWTLAVALNATGGRDAGIVRERVRQRRGDERHEDRPLLRRT